MKKRVILLVFFFFISTSPVLAQDVFTEESYRELVFQKLDVYVDGSITPVIVNMTVEMDYLMSAFVNIYWEDNAIDWQKFGHGNGTPALANGTTAVKDGHILPNRVKTMEDLFDTAVVINYFVDAKNPIGNHLTVEIDFHTYVPPYGLKMSDGHTFGWIVADNIPAYCEDFSVFVLGWKTIHLEPDFDRSWLEETLQVDTPVELVLFPFVMPLALIFTWDGALVILGVVLYFIEFFTLWKILTYRSY